MKILLIGNFTPPYEEENLHNLSLLRKLEEEGHECRIINISATPSTDERFIDTKSYIDFVFKTIRFCWGKDVVHFLTKGYLRLGLLKLMTSILIGKLFRAKSFITIHSELFSIQGQMRSPVGGRQTLFTAFTFADKIICADKDTYNVAAMYMKKSNFELIPSFIYLPENITTEDNAASASLQDNAKTIVFANVKYPSFAFEILREILSNYPLPSDTRLVICLSEKPTMKLQRAIRETGKNMSDNLIFVEPNDLNGTILAYSKADIIIRPLSCDGLTFFEDFSVSVKKTLHTNNYIYFPGGLLFVKEGDTAEMCVCIINTMLCVEAGTLPELKTEDSYNRMKSLYEG